MDWLGLRVICFPSLFFLDPAIQAGPDTSNLAWLLVLTNNPASEAGRRELIHACTAPCKVINYLRTIFQNFEMKLWAGGRTLTWAKTKMRVMILAPAEERPSLPLPFSLSPFCLLRSLVLSRFLPFLIFFLPCLSAFFWSSL